MTDPTPDAARPTAAELQRWDRQHIWHPFTPMQLWESETPVVIVRGEGNELIDVDGRRYLDGVSSLWCNVHGHSRPEINAAITAQIDAIAHSTLLGLTHPPAVLLAKRLVDLAPPGLTRVFYSDNGATSVEVAIRMALQFWQMTGRTARTTFASLRDSYHGDTLGAVGAGYSDAFHHFYRAVLPNAIRLTPPHIWRWRDRLSDADALDRAVRHAEDTIARHADEIAAVVIEPLMQGAAGMWPQPPAYLHALRRITAQHGILLICDEVATGFGRTGTMFACNQADVAPDFLCLAKGLTGGYLPLAATLTTEQVYEAFLGPPAEGRTFFYGHTYTGNPLGCAAALASLDLFDSDRVFERLDSSIPHLTDRLTSWISPLPHVADIRQRGTMVGIELAADANARVAYPPAERVGAQVASAARADSVIVRPLGDVIVLMPPLSIERQQIDHLVRAVRDAISTVTER